MMLLNKQHTRDFILNKFQSMRPHLGIERVSGDVYDRLDAKLRAWLIAEIDRYPSLNQKTFKL